jgi:hypothetical protein
MSALVIDGKVSLEPMPSIDTRTSTPRAAARPRASAKFRSVGSLSKMEYGSHVILVLL